jgi:hypothetical protein
MYLSLASRRLLLKKAMGCSKPSSFFWRRTAASVYSDANEKMRKSLRYSGLASTGASLITF